MLGIKRMGRQHENGGRQLAGVTTMNHTELVEKVTRKVTRGGGEIFRETRDRPRATLGRRRILQVEVDRKSVR